MGDAYTFCPFCAQPLERSFEGNGDQARLACARCNFVHYESASILVSCLITYGGRLLWIKRGTEPRKGYWTQPGGFMESGERPEEAAARELIEETGVTISPDSLTLYAIGSLPEISEVYLVYRGCVDSDVAFTTLEAEEVGFFSFEDAPWSKQAYPEVVDVLQLFYAEHEKNRYGIYSCSYSNSVNQYLDLTRQLGPERLD